MLLLQDFHKDFHKHLIQPPLNPCQTKGDAGSRPSSAKESSNPHFQRPSRAPRVPVDRLDEAGALFPLILKLGY